MSTYNTYQLQDVQGYLANRLYDPTNQFWSLAELTLYIQEALQTWNALTNFWRGDFTFQTNQNQWWYDLTQLTNTLRPMTATIAGLYPILNYHLLEPPTGIVSAQFTQAEQYQAILFRENEVLSECGTNPTVEYIPAVNGRITLADGTFDVIRISYQPAAPYALLNGYGAGAYGMGPYGVSNEIPGYPQNTTLWKEDTWAEQSFNEHYLQAPAGLPFAYLMSTQGPISFDTDCPPGFGGQYEVMLTGEAGASSIIIPNDWVHILKWGALAYLLNTESNAKDNSRAKYCEERFKLGKIMLQNASALLAMRCNNVPLQVDSVMAGDQYNTRWQAQASNTPQYAYQAGLNLVALSPAPWSTCSMTATVVENAPLPVDPTDFVQVSQDVLDTLLDYAQHLAAFKMGGAEFSATMPMLERFMTEAKVYNSKLAEMGEYNDFLLGISQMNERRNPRLDPEVLA